MDAMGDREGPRLVSSTALWRGDRRPAQIVQVSQLEQDFQRAPQQRESGSLPFDTEYSRWLEEHTKHMNELRTAVKSHASEPELRRMWKTPAERCFVWIGDFRPSLLLKLLGNQLEPLGEQQLLVIKIMQRTCHEVEDALSQGMQSLEQSLAEALANGSPATEGSLGDVSNYMVQMAMAMGKLATLEGFLLQADNLRQQTLQQMHRILTTRQSARALLAISEYFSRLRALSSLWLSRPREQ
ncbi:hypothetical protein MTR67_046002 [Solanum verrucosum]|uniref:DOG1 domain-containing protein n=1 Tax=Solanum verrucosum TaxID=315347 RepID=A0AAF0UUF8_SOLVR|nr:hypothetical protein MTR67_046002 [Solanum verrucosum]